MDPLTATGSRTSPGKYDKRRYQRRSRIEIMFGRLKDWRRVAARYDRCSTAFLSAVALAANVILSLIGTLVDFFEPQGCANDLGILWL